VARLFDGLMGRGAYYAHERQFWHALWRVPPIDAVEEHGIEVRHYGPVRAFAYRHEPLLSLFNVVLGADLPGAISEGHLGDALSWTESMGLDVRIPLRGSSQEVGEAAEAADYLRTYGYRRTGMSATFAREGRGEEGLRDHRGDLRVPRRALARRPQPDARRLPPGRHPHGLAAAGAAAPPERRPAAGYLGRDGRPVTLALSSSCPAVREVWGR
jgi:hypothetical protein